MIKQYTDHAANERTYLAWIRTSISMMAFGFIIEKFDLIVSHAVDSVKTGELAHAVTAVQFIGLIVFVSGILMTLFATIRFFRYKAYIESEESHPYHIKYTNIFLSILIIVLSLLLLFYMIEFEIDIKLGLG